MSESAKFEKKRLRTLDDDEDDDDDDETRIKAKLSALNRSPISNHIRPLPDTTMKLRMHSRGNQKNCPICTNTIHFALEPCAA